jgi:hypothetical protein
MLRRFSAFFRVFFASAKGFRLRKSGRMVKSKTQKVLNVAEMKNG